MIGSVSGYSGQNYNYNDLLSQYNTDKAKAENDLQQAGSDKAALAASGQSGKSDSTADTAKPDINPGESNEKKPGRKSSPAECETCKHRKYQDGSNEMVSFKSATHISPTAAASAVRAHEGEHVSNAYKKAAQNNGKVIQAAVSIHTAICPECGRTYVSGGETKTQIKYYNESNPYQQNMKSADAGKYSGMNLDAAV